MMNERYKDRIYIGSGGMASVYKAFDQTLERFVAIKEMAEQLRTFAEVRHLFLNEARKMASIRHQNVVQVYDVSEEGNVPTIIMEFMAGGSVASRMDSGALASDEVLRIVRQVGLGLQAIHDAGLVHRDVKPENILEENGVYKITDFGVAMSGEEDALPFVTSKYAAPEVLVEPDKIGPSSDIYSLGIMATELLLGHRQFEEAVREAIEKDNKLQLPAIRDSAQAFWQQWVASPVELPPLNKLDNSITPEVAEFLAGMTRRERSARIADCKSVLKELDALMKLGGQRAQAPTEYSPKMKRQLDQSKARNAEATDGGKRKKPLWFKAVIGVGGLLLVAVLALFLIPAGPPRFHLDVVSDPAGASVTVNGEVLENYPTPTWFNGAWGDTLVFAMDGRPPIELVLAEESTGLSQTEEGYRLEVGWPKALEIKTSADAAEYFRQKLPQAWTLNVALENAVADASSPGHYTVEVGSNLNFAVESAQKASLAMIHLGSDNMLTLIYPNPFGFTPETVSGTASNVGPEIGLVAREPLGKEWFVFFSAAEVVLPPEIPGVQPVGNWATLYPIDGNGSPGESLVFWLTETVQPDASAGAIVEIDVVEAEQSE